MVVRDTVATGIAAEDVAVVVAGAVCVCPAASAAAKTMMARDSFLTTLLDPGENLEILNHLYVAGYERE